MKIEGSLKPNLAPASSPPQPRAAQTTPVATPSDAVSLSTLAGSLVSNERPTVNASRIQEIKDAIAQGKFRINPEAIADHLLETARDLVGSQRKS